MPKLESRMSASLWYCKCSLEFSSIWQQATEGCVKGHTVEQNYKLLNRIVKDTSLIIQLYITSHHHSFVLILMRRCIVPLECCQPLHMLLIQLLRNVFTLDLRLFSIVISLTIYKLWTTSSSFRQHLKTWLFSQSYPNLIIWSLYGLSNCIILVTLSTLK